MSWVTEFGKGLLNVGGNRRTTPSYNLGSSLGKSMKRNPIGYIGTTAVGIGLTQVPGRMDELDNDIEEYNQFWIDKQGHSDAPRLEDYQNTGSYVEDGVTYTRDNYDPMEEYSKDYSLYWDMRPLDMEYR